MTVLNRHHGNIPDDAIYIGRGSRWGNPFVIGKDGNRDEVCEKYVGHLDQQMALGKITTDDLAALHGKDLVCYCAPARCHGHYLERVAMMHSQNKSREPFKVIIAGGRNYKRTLKDIRTINKILHRKHDVIMVTGCADGADQIPYYYHRHKKYKTPIKEFPADWDNLDAPGAIVKYRRDKTPYNAKAGIDRNIQMAEYADALIAFWDGVSTGTKNMLDEARIRGLKVRVIRY